MAKLSILKGDLFYLPASVLSITGAGVKQVFKVQIHHVTDLDKFIVLVKHWRTKKCNKVTVELSRKAIEVNGFKVSV